MWHKSAGLRILKALQFEKWGGGGLEPCSLAYGQKNFRDGMA